MRAALLALLVQLPDAKPKKKSQEELDDQVYRTFACDACLTVLNGLRADLKYLIETEKKWSKKVLNERITVSCEDSMLMIGEQSRAACDRFLKENNPAIARLLQPRWDPKSDIYEEDIQPREFCKSLTVCNDNQETITTMLNKDQQKREKEQFEEQDKEREEINRQKREQFQEEKRRRLEEQAEREKVKKAMNAAGAAKDEM